MKELLSAPLSPRKIIEYLLLFLLLALVLSAVAYGGYWYGKKAAEPVAPPVTPQGGSRRQPPAENGELAGWKTYTDAQFGYSLKYPPTWSFSEIIKQPYTGLGPYKSSLKFNFKTNNDVPNVKVNILDSGSDFAKNIDRGVERVTLGGVSGSRISREQPGQVFHDVVYIERGRYLYEIELEFSKGEEQYKNDFQQVLSTFRFLDQKPAGGEASPNIPSSWRVYDNVFGVTKFSFRYPETLEVWDDDPQSGSIYLSKKDANNNPIYVFLDTFSHVYGPYYFGEYKSGSRRAWFIENMKEPYPDVAFSDLAFKEVNFTGGKSYLQVVPWPVGEGEGGDFYFGVQNGIPFYVINMQIDEKILSKEDFLKILSTITVKK